MEKIPEINIAEQLKKDREELKAAGMIKNDDDPHPGGKFEEQMRAQTKKNQDKINDDEEFGKEKKPEFSPEEAEKIKKIAHYISERRIAGEDKGARDWQEELAKEYGLDEKAFSREAIEKLLFDNGLGDKHWTPEAQKFMQHWDLGKAEEAFRNMKKAGEQTPDPNAAGSESKPEDLAQAKQGVTDKQPYTYTQGDETMAFSKDWKEKKFGQVEKKSAAQPEKKEVEAIPGSLEALKQEMEAKRLAYAQLDLDKSRKWIKLKNLLGARIKEVKDEDFERVKSEYEQARSSYLEAKKTEVLTKGDKEGAKQFLLEFEGTDEAIKFLNLKYDLKKEQSGYPAKILYGFEKLANGWKEMSWKKKIAISVAIMGVGFAATATAGLTFGGVGALAFTLRTAQRTLGAGAMYIGVKKWQDTRSLNKIQGKSEDRINTLLSNDDWLKRIENLESKHVSTRFDFNKEQIEALDKKHKRRALALAGLVGVGGTAFDMYRHGVFKGLGGAIKEKMVGSSILASSTSAEGMGGGAAATQAVEHLQPTGGMPQDLSEGDYARIQKTMASYGPGRNMDEMVAGEAAKMHNDGIMPEHEVKTSDLRAPDAGPQIAKPKFEEIASGEFGKGGSIEGKVTAAIEASPEDFGLHESDPDFAKKALEMKKSIIEDFYKEKGFKSYAEFDRYCRKNVWDKDIFRIVHNPVTHDIILECKGHGFHDVFSTGDVLDVSPGGSGAAAQEIASSKASIPVDDVKPKAGIVPEEAVKSRTGVADQHPSRGAGKAMQYETDTPDQINAKKEFALADKYQKDLRAFNAQEAARLEGVNEMANDQSFSSTKEGIEKIFHESGIGIRANILDRPMSAWEKLIATENYISKDVQDADAVGKMNINLNKLKYLRLILGRYNTSGNETIGYCLKQAVKNPKILYLINKSVL